MFLTLDNLRVHHRKKVRAWLEKRTKDGSDDDGGNFKGRRRSNDTHASRTEPDARLYRKGNTASELRYMGHTLSDNRHSTDCQCGGHYRRWPCRAGSGQSHDC